MNDFGRLVEAEIPRLRRYARALTRDAVRADDLVQSCLNARCLQAAPMAGRDRLASLAFYYPAQPARQLCAALNPRGNQGRSGDCRAISHYGT